MRLMCLLLKQLYKHWHCMTWLIDMQMSTTMHFLVNNRLLVAATSRILTKTEINRFTKTFQNQAKLCYVTVTHGMGLL